MFNGILNILKPPGMTSHDVVSYVRRLYGLKRVGHAGTLDPAAAGVLPVFLGHATRLIEYQAEADKSYRTELTLGYSTDTGDDTGAITNSSAFIMPEKDTILKCLNMFQGTILQLPPMYSAIKINGQKLYDLARAGITVERSPREVVIHSISLLSIRDNTILFDVTCSKGTYIRTLCNDIGSILAIPAVMSFLIRTRVGVFHLENSYTLEELCDKKEAALLSPETAIAHLAPYYFDRTDSLDFRNGKQIFHQQVCSIEKTLGRVYDDADNFIGIASVEGRIFTPIKVFHPN